MPAAVVAVAAAASAYGAAAGAVALGLVAAESFGAMAIGMLAASLVSMVGNAMLGGKKGGAAPSLNFSYEARENKQMVRQPITAHRLIYGTTKVSGPITFIDTTGNGDYCHLLLTLAGHEVEEIGEVWFNDDLITLSGNAATGKWADHAWVWKGLGTASGDADLWAALRSECTNWTTDHRQSGRAKIYCKFKWDSKLFSSGIPTVRVVIKGRKLADPRTSTTAFSANPALAIRAYLMDTIYGLKATASEIDDASFIAAANVCDELVTLAGGGTEKRYTLNGTVDTAKAPKEVLQEMLTALGGRLLYAGGKWRLYAAAWRSPSVTLGEDDLDGPIRLTTRQARRDLCNGVKGVYVSPDNYWQSSDYPVIEGASYLAEDGERMWRDFDLPYTTSAATAQRLAKIELERTRRQMATVWPCKLTAMRVQAGDVVRLSNTRFGWSNKTFEVVDWRFSLRGNENAPRIGIDLTLRESDANVYAWASAEEQQPAAAPLSNLPNPFDIPAPTGLTLASGTAELLLMGDGTVVSRIKANWTDSATAYIDDVEIQFKKAADSVWQSAPPVHKGGQEIFLSPVLDGVAYDVRIRSVSTLGSPSAWTTVTGHVVIGKTSPPEDVTGFSSAVNGGVVVFRWNPVGDADLAGYDIRYGAASSSWSAKTPLTTTTRGTQITTAAVPPGTWEFAINAVDTSGNASVNAALSSATVGNSNNLIASAPQAPGWPGTLSGFVKHWTGVLMPDCTMLASDMTDAELWDTFVAAPVTTATYTQAGEQALAIDGSPRLWAAVAAALGPGESTGAPLPHLEVATRTLAGSYGPWRPWTIGTEPCGAFKMRVGFNTAGGVVVLSEFTPTADAPFATESHSGLSVPLAGLVLTFDQPFQLAPNVQVTPVATGAQIGVATGVSNSGCTILLFTTAGTAASGTVNVTITGPR